MVLTKRTCFIITPIGDEKDAIRRHMDGVIDAIITPVMKNDYEIKVAHRLFQTGSINKQIIELIYESDLVIANLTERNPNVMYELAFRHTLGTPTITIAENGTKLPFDISSERTIFYKNDIQGVMEAQEELKMYLSQIDYNSGKTTGPIHDYLDSVELNNLIYSYNKNENSTGILDLMVKRLEGIENKILRIENETKSDLSDNTVKKPIQNIKAFKNAKINTGYFFYNQKINLIKDTVDYETVQIKGQLLALSQSLERNNFTSDSILLWVSEFNNFIEAYKNEIDDIYNNM